MKNIFSKSGFTSEKQEEKVCYEYAYDKRVVL